MTTREISIKESKGAFSIFKKNAKEEYNFSDLSSLRRLLSNEKSRILGVIKDEKPSSLYELSKKLGRNFKAVYYDVKLLERFGFVEFVEEKTKNRIRLKPRLKADVITINIRI